MRPSFIVSMGIMLLIVGAIVFFAYQQFGSKSDSSDTISPSPSMEDARTSPVSEDAGPGVPPPSDDLDTLSADIDAAIESLESDDESFDSFEAEDSSVSQDLESLSF